MPLLQKRIRNVRAALGKQEADAVLLNALPDIRWACGFTGSNGLLLVTPSAAYFLTDGRYDVQARQEVRGADIHIVQGQGLLAYAAEHELLKGLGAIAFQSDHTTVQQLQELREHFSDVTWQPVAGLLSTYRAAKEEGEIARIRRAQAITDAVFDVVCAMIAPGCSEQEIAARIVYEHLKRGASAMAFDPIVASGPNAARPHARPTHRKLQTGDWVVIDMGCFWEGYASDMTRTVAVGRASEEQRRAYHAVLAAQEAAIKAAKAGITGAALDRVARGVLEKAGLGDYFAHSLGHGVGLEVHEAPRLSQRTEDTLPDGAVVTVEPGVYVPDAFGIRIEDLVVIREAGCENLTASTKELLVLE